MNPGFVSVIWGVTTAPVVAVVAISGSAGPGAPPMKLPITSCKLKS